MSNSNRLTGRNALIAAMFEDGVQLKHYYRFIALNPHINLHDACNILLARPDATICYPYEEWNEIGRQVKRGKKSIAYYDYDGYKQYVFDVSDTRGDNQNHYSAMPIENMIIGFSELNGVEITEAEESDYTKLLKGTKFYLHEQGLNSGDEQRDELLAEGIAFSLYTKAGLHENEHIGLQGLPFSYQDNADFVKEVYVQAEMLYQEIEDAYRNKQEEITVIDDTEEETVSDEPIVDNDIDPASNLIQMDEVHSSRYKGYNVYIKYHFYDETHLIEEVYLGKEKNHNSENVYDNSDNSLKFVSINSNIALMLSPDGFYYSQQELINRGLFSELDYKEYAEIEKNILSNLQCEQELKFDRKENDSNSGVPFRYPNWQDEQTVEHTELTQVTPYYQKYLIAQNINPKAVVLMRLGDFYEIMGESAQVVSAELDLTLTGRDVGLSERVPMCGVPFHAVDEYLNKILQKHSVLLVEENAQPKYIHSHAEALEQSAEADEKFQFKDIEIREISYEHSLFTDADEQKIIDFYNEVWLDSFPETKIEIAEITKTSKAFSKLSDAEKYMYIIARDMFTYVGSDVPAIEDLHAAILKKYEIVQQKEDEEDKTKAKTNLTELKSNEPTPFDDEQLETEDDWRNELAEELSDLADEQSDEKVEETEVDEDEEIDETDSSSDEQDENEDSEQEEEPKENVKSTQKKPEKGIKDRKRKEKPQASLFDLLEPQEKSREEKWIEYELKRGSHFQDGKFRIFDKYNENPSEKTFAEFLKREYGIGGSYVDNTDETHDSKGIHLRWIEKEHPDNNLDILLKWPEVAVRIADLIDDDNYLSEQEKKEYVNYRIEQNRLREQRAEEERRKNELIDKFIYDANTERKQRILDEYANTTKLITFSEFLRNEYGTNEELGDGYFVIYNLHGVWLRRGEKSYDFQNRIYLNWDEFADKVCNLIENDRYIEQSQPQEETLKPEQKIEAIVDGIVKEGTEKTTDGKWFVYFEDFKENEQFVREHKHQIAEQLVLRKEVAEGGMDDISIDATFHLEYCPNYDWDADDEKEDTEQTKPTFNRFKELAAEGKAYFDSYQIRYRYGIEPSYSMWGEIQSCKTIAYGIYEVSTAGHGGVMISTELAPHILSPEALKKGVKERGYYCYEEDCDAAIPLRELYDKGILDQANEYFTHFYVKSNRTEAEDGRIKGSVPFKVATEEEKTKFFDWWNNSVICSLVDWNKEYWQAHELTSEQQQINAIVDRIVKEGTKNTTNGNWIFLYEDFKDDEQFVVEHVKQIADLLESREEVSDVMFASDGLDINYYLDFCPNAELKDEVNTDLAGVLDQSELGGAKTRFRNNVEAIKLVNRLYADKRNPTEAEKKILAKFVGWGGLSQAFDEKNEGWQKEYAELKALLPQEDYEQARGSTLNAYYTAKDVINGIYTALNRFGVKGNNRILEPSMGTGNFFGFMPKDIADGARLYGVELDNLTGRIATKLYPQANVQIKGFEDTSFPNKKFDIVVGNVPFGGYGVADSDYNKYNFKVHDYFLAKSIDKVKPNGVVAIITSKGTMDKLNQSARKYVAERADLLGAIRLPNTAFKQTAGTEAVADILFFRKREYQIAADETNTEWLKIGKTAEGYEINQYFIDHPEMVLGTLAEETGLYGGIDTTVKPDGRELSTALSEAISHLPQDFYENPETVPEADIATAEDYDVKPFCFKAVNGKLYMRVGDEMQEQPLPKFPKDAYQRIESMIELREELHHVLDMQTNGCSDEVLQREQVKLNRLYDLFVRRYGNINSQTNIRLFKEDGDSALLFACEDIDEETKAITKADVFSKRTIRPYVVPTNTDDCFEALQISKNERGRVDIAYIEELTGKSYDDVLFELGDSVFRNPETTNRTDKYSGFETSEEYLSGLVRDKLYTARHYAAEFPEFKKNVEALEQVQPTPLSASEIAVRLGQTWVDKEYYKQFYCELVGVPWYSQGNVELFYNPHDSSWRLDQKDDIRYNTQMKQKQVYGTTRAPAYRLFIDSMNLRPTTIYDTVLDADGKERRVLNQAETIAAREKQNKIKEEFANWIFSTPERREELVATYNRLFNRIKLPSYDGSYLKFPEMNPAIEIKPHQKNAVHRIITSNDSTLLHHVVGSGKTYTMAASIMKMRQLGLCKKAMVAVPNHLVQQWASEWRKLYPNAKILVATKEDLEKDNRQKFVSKVAMGDWDGIIIAQSSFAKIPISYERQVKKLQEEIASVELTIQNQWEEKGMPRGAVKNLERIKKNKKTQLKKLMDDSKKDSVLNFESLGVDYLYVDEAHYYKNLFMFSKMSNVAGISNAASQRASDLKLKCEYLQELHGNDRGVVFATGTPISNSMTEMYTMQTYLQPSVLKDTNIMFFDGWAADFGETITSMELAPSGQGYRARTRFAKFTNLPELLKMYRSFADVQTADMVKLNVPEAERKVINLKPSDTVIHLAEEIAERAERIYGGGVDTHIDNMLKVTSDGKKLALDPRCYVPTSNDEQSSKINEAAQRIHEIWEDTENIKGTQIVFCDLSTPKRKFEDFEYGTHFDAYNELKYKLVQKGIPAAEIAFIHDANTDEQKQALFDSVNSGAIRVLIGSTEKCGAGTNVQKRLVALHHLDTPYRPSDMAQREGRIIRQGNTNEKVQIFTYVTERTFDSYSYQILENKQRFISQIDRGDLTVREAEDIDETTLSYAEIKAITAANPKIKRKMEVDMEIARLRVLEGQYRKNLYDLQDKIRKGFPEDIRKQELLIERVTLDLMHYQSSKPSDPEEFKISVRGTEYSDKKDGGQALMDALYASKPDTVVAEYCGFKISMNPMSSLTNEREITLTANGQYTITISDSAFGNLQRMDNFFNDLPARKERLEKRLIQFKDDLEIAKEQVEKPFEQAEQLSALLSEQTQLNAELNLDKREETIIEDSNDSDDGNYRMLPTEKDIREVNIIDEEDKVAAMKIEVLPDYSITQDEMHEYGYKWDGMLPISKNRALKLWTMGVTVCKLGKDDEHVEVDDYVDFDDGGNTMYGIEKPVWKKFIDGEKSAPYLFARLHVTSAVSNMISEEMNYIDDKFIGKFKEDNFKERSNLEDFLPYAERPDNDKIKSELSYSIDDVTERLWCDELKMYGWAKSDIPKSIAAHIADGELKDYAKQSVKYLDASKDLMIKLGSMSKEEIDALNLPDSLYDELTVVSKEPSIMLDDEGKTYLPGLLAFRNEITGDYYVVNDTSARTKSGKELEVGDKTDVETVLAYDGLINGNPLREFHTEKEAKEYYLEKVNVMRSVAAKSTDYRQAVKSSALLEYDEFKKSMLNLPQSEVFSNNYKIHCFNEFGAVIDDDEEYFSDDDYKALYRERGHILESLYNDFIDSEGYSLENYDGTISFIESFCKFKHADIYNNKPIYLHSFKYAAEHSEEQEYRSSHKISENCKNDLTQAIRENFDGMHLNSGFEDELIQKYGMDRVALIVATTINEHDFDGRYSRANKEWAKSIPMSESEDERSNCCLNVHPAVLDGFTNRIRKKIKENQEDVVDKGEISEVEKLVEFAESGDYEKIKAYYAFIYERGPGGTGRYQAYVLEEGETEMYPMFEDVIETEEELERKWKELEDSKILAPMNLTKCEPHELLKMSNQNNQEDNQKMEQDKYLKVTPMGFKVLEITKDKDDRNIAIIHREQQNDYIVAARYNTADGTWAQGEYCGTLEAAKEYRHETYDKFVVKETGTGKRNWIFAHVAKDALVAKHQFTSFFRLPTYSKYPGYGYSIFNNRIKEGRQVSDLQSESRELCYDIRLAEDEEIILKHSSKDEIKLTARELMELVSGTLSKDYDPKPRVEVNIPKEAKRNVYDNSTMFVLPNSAAEDKFTYFIPNRYITNGTDENEGRIILSIPEDFEIKAQNTDEEEITYTLQEFVDLCNNTTADDYKVEENADGESEENSTWHYVTVDKSAKVAQYDNSSLFKMPKGEFTGYTYYIPNGFLTENEEKGTIRIGMPEDFVVKPKDNATGDEKSMTVEEFVEQVKNKKPAAYRYFQKPSEEAKTQFAKMEERLRRNIPEEMKERPNWVAITTFEKENGKLGKRPIDCNTGKYASDNDPATWADFDTACKFAKENGAVTLAYALDGEDKIACIDLDGCIQENDDFTELAQKTFNLGNGTYCERSVSGKGLHVFGKTDDKTDLRSFSKDGDMEFYRRARFIAVTGDYYGSSELKSFDTPEMQSLLESKFEKRPVITNAGKGVEGFSTMSDRDVYDKACASYRGERFKDLFDGKDLQNNHSNSDMSLMNLLAFWCNGDKDQMLRMFTASGLYRPEKSAEYYECTMLKALQGTTDRYNPKPQSEQKKPVSGNGSGNNGKR